MAVVRGLRPCPWEYLTTALMSRADDDNLGIKKNSNVKIVYVLINKFTVVSDEYDFHGHRNMLIFFDQQMHLFV